MSPVRFVVPGLGLGCVLSYILCFVRRFDAGLACAGFEQLTALMYGALIALVLTGVASFVLRGRADGGRAAAVRARVAQSGRPGDGAGAQAQADALGKQGHDSPCGRDGAPDVRACALGALLCLIATAVLAAAAFGADVALPVLFCAGLALGVGLFLVCREWFCLSVLLDPTDLLLCLAVAVTLAGATQAVFKLVSAPALAVALLVLLCVGSFAAFVVPTRPAHVQADPTEGEFHSPVATPSLLAVVCDLPEDLRGPDAPLDLGRICTLLWIPLAGLAFCSFITGLTWDPVLADETAWRSVVAEVPGVFVGALASALVIAFAGSRHGAEGRFGILARAAQPVAISLVLVIPVIKQLVSGPVVAVFSTTFSAAGFALLTGAAFAEFCVAVAETRCDPRRFAGFVMALCSLAALAGLASIEVLGTDGRILCFVLEAVYFTAVAVSYALRSLPSARPDAAASHDAASETPATFDEGAFEARCRALAAQRGLSRRELDVLLYAGRGYGSSYIAPALGISENTVRTHVRHIYEKLGVSSRAGLIALLDSREG